MNKSSKSIVDHKLDELHVELSAHGVKFDKATAYNVPVKLHITYSPGAPARGMHGAMEDAEEAIPAEISIDSIVLVRCESLLSDGMAVELNVGDDVKRLLDRHEIEAIEENLLARVGGEA